jgi:cold shock CspA family protein
VAKSQETWNKKEKEKLRAKKKEEKAHRKEERKANATGDGSLDSMIAYVDEYGNLSSTPPNPLKKREHVNADSIEVGVPRRKPVDEADLIRKGVVTFFNESKGFGFIKDLDSQDSVFTHINGHQDTIKENDRVTFLVEQGPKGLNATNVKLQK